MDLIRRAGLALAATALAAAGCGRAALPAAQTTSLDGGFLELRLTLPDGSPPFPTVISFLGADEALVGAGFAVATFTLHWEMLRGLAPPPPPPPPAGDAPAASDGPMGVWLLASPTPRTVGQPYFGLIAASVRAVGRVVDHLATRADVDAGRLGIAGSSTNGFVALEAAADARIRAVVAVAAAGDYLCFLERSGLAMRGAPLALDPAYARELHARQPAEHPERLTHAAVLLVNGAADVAVPAACAERTAAALRPAYERAGVADRFELVLVEGAGHNQLADVARERALAWFGHWLAPDSRRP